MSRFKNPLTKIREQNKLSKYELARLCRVSVPLIHQIEQGIMIRSDKVFQALGSIFGLDPVKLQAEYSAWRDEQYNARFKSIQALSKR